MEQKLILEALLFSAQKPLSPAELRDLMVQATPADETGVEAKPRKPKVEELTTSLDELAAEHESAGRSYRLVCVAGAWQFVSRPEYAPWLRALVGHKPRPPRLTQASLETLAIIAYRQPLTRAEIEQVRGVSVDGVMQTLLERELVEPVGRAEVVGRPMKYGTTAKFLEYFGLRAIEDLPAADELRRIPVQRPPEPVTIEPGLATAPPTDLAAPTAPEGAPNPPVPATDPVSGLEPSDGGESAVHEAETVVDGGGSVASPSNESEEKP
jgi:segregation and condensation protein B